MEILLKKQDIDWLELKHPELHYDRTNNTIKGEASFDKSYKNVSLVDSFEIKINLSTKANSILPITYPLGSRVSGISRKWGILEIDLHVNDDGSFCLCIGEEEKYLFPDGFDLKIFFNTLLLNHLYWLAYYERYGEGAWEGYYHGVWGYFEMYANNKIQFKRLRELVKNDERIRLLRRRKGHHFCLCESGKKIKNCHKDLYRAAHKLEREKI